MRVSRVLVFSGLLAMVCCLFAACGGSGGSHMMPMMPLTITSTSLPNATVNVPYSNVLQATGGSGTFTWSIASGSLPPGLSLNAMNGFISGTPTTGGSYSFTAQVADGASHTATKNLTINVEGALLITCNSCAPGTNHLPAGSVGVPYMAMFSATGGTPPYTWCIPELNGNCDDGTGGGLPAGLTISTDSNGNGIISGTPSSQPAAPLIVNVEAMDSETIRASGTIQVVLAIFSVATKTLPNGIINQPYQAPNGTHVQVIAAGGMGPYTWSVSAGSLPPGLMLGPCVHLQSSSCAITGTPTQLGLFNFTVSVTDGETPPATATGALSIDVTDSTLTVTTRSLPAGNVNLPYSAVVQASGGDGNNTWSVASGTLPPGLSLNSSTGAISGTPTTQGQSNFIIEVQDGENPPQMAMSGPLSISVNAPITNALLTGNFAVSFTGYDNGTLFIMAGAVIADGHGNITGGELDYNNGQGEANGNNCSQPICPIPQAIQAGSSYDLSAGTGVGTMTLHTLDASNNPHTYVFSVAVNGNACVLNSLTSACGRLVLRDPANPHTYGSGVLLVQDSAYFSLDAFFPGNFSVLLNGLDPSGNRYAAIGAIGTDRNTKVDINCNTNLGNWHLAACPLQVNDNGTAGPDSITGAQFSATIDPNTGRGSFVNIRFPNDSNLCTGTFPVCGYAYYIVNQVQAILISTDPLSRPANMTLWSAYRLLSSAGWTLGALNQPDVAELTGRDGQNPDVTAGLFTPDGMGNASFSGDENDAGTLSQQSSAGTYALGTNGNITGFFTLNGFSQPALSGASVFLYRNNTGYFVGSDPHVTSGVIEPQTGAPFTNGSLSGSLQGGSFMPATSNVTNSVTEMFADGVGDITATQYTAGPGGVGGPNQLTLAYSVDGSGRAVVNQNGNEFGVLYVIGPSKFVLLPAGNNPALSIFISGQPD
jgi:hypothetical protein